jgi:hypothetical protein
MPAATAAADPLELPPGVCSTFRGFRVGGDFGILNWPTSAV